MTHPFRAFVAILLLGTAAFADEPVTAPIPGEPSGEIAEIPQDPRRSDVGILGNIIFGAAGVNPETGTFYTAAQEHQMKLQDEKIAAQRIEARRLREQKLAEAKAKHQAAQKRQPDAIALVPSPPPAAPAAPVPPPAAPANPLAIDPSTLQTPDDVARAVTDIVRHADAKELAAPLSEIAGLSPDALGLGMEGMSVGGFRLSMINAWFLWLCAFSTVVVAVGTWLRDRTDKTPDEFERRYRRRQLGRRLTTAALLVALGALFPLGDGVLDMQDPGTFTGYWAAMIGLSLLLMVVWTFSWYATRSYARLAVASMRQKQVELAGQIEDLQKRLALLVKN